VLLEADLGMAVELASEVDHLVEKAAIGRQRARWRRRRHLVSPSIGRRM
jgi:hypothetical protein